MRSLRTIRLLFVGVLLTAVALLGYACPPGLKPGAYVQLADAGVNKYLGQFTPVSTAALGDSWTRHDFDPTGGMVRSASTAAPTPSSAGRAATRRSC